MKAFHYDRRQFAEALRQGGLKRGDVVFSHSNVGYFGYPAEGRTPQGIFETILGAFKDVIGEEGTLVVPTFTYSFARRQPFDPDRTESTMGMFAEMLRRHPASCRSHDPLFSVAALGGRAQELTANVSRECFGKDSFWDRFLKADGIVCNMNLDAGSTFIHYVEHCLNVPYRYDKVFHGVFIVDGKHIKGEAIYFCVDISNRDLLAEFGKFDAVARSRGVVQSVRVGRGAVVCIRASDVLNVIRDELKRDPWLLTACGQVGKTPKLVRPVDKSSFNVSLSKNAAVQEIVKSLGHLPRGLLSDGYDVALDALSQQVVMKTHEYPTGTHCWEWIVPEKWTCCEAYLETLDGRRIFSYEDNALHVPPYCQSFDATVTREQLFEHLTVHPLSRAAIPYRHMLFERDWGLCCSQEVKETLADEEYRVHIRTEFSYSTLKVGEVVIPGEHEDSIILCAHLDHPAEANDGLTGAVVGIGVVRELLKRRQLRYTYRFLIVPNTLGSLAYLSHNEQLIPKMRGGLFLGMLGLPNPPALQLSHHGRTEVDLCFSLAMKEHAPLEWTDSFLRAARDDERQFEALGVRVPMLSLSRPLPPSVAAPDHPDPEFRSSNYTLGSVSLEHLEESRDLVLHMIDVLENNLVPASNPRGGLHLTPEDICDDSLSAPEESQKMAEVLLAIDGSRTLADIADTCALSFGTVKRMADRLWQHGLLTFRDPHFS